MSLVITVVGKAYVQSIFAFEFRLMVFSVIPPVICVEGLMQLCPVEKGMRD